MLNDEAGATEQTFTNRHATATCGRQLVVPSMSGVMLRACVSDSGLLVELSRMAIPILFSAVRGPHVECG
jgi:hypothetical protein